MSIIVIAHRLSTIRDANKIIVLCDGVKTEEGNHEALLANYPDGTYASFVAKQSAAEADVEEGDANEDEVDPAAVEAAEKEAALKAEEEKAQKDKDGKPKK